MEYVNINEAFTAIVPIPESHNTDTVTYSVYKASDATVFASGTATFVAGINWKISFTPNVADVYIVEVNDTTLEVIYSQSFKAVRNATMTASVTTAAAATDSEMLVKINEAITTRLNGGAVQSYSINGRNLQYVTLQELWQLRRDLEVAISGKAGGARNYASFVNPE